MHLLTSAFLFLNRTVHDHPTVAIIGIGVGLAAAAVAILSDRLAQTD